MKPAQKIALGDYSWHFKEATANIWRRCSKFPTVVQHELRELGELPDEGIEFNERKIQWAGEKDWVFHTKFTTPQDVKDYEVVELVFDGLDTIATVTLNEKEILKCDNMFVPEKVNVKEMLAAPGDENYLEIYFASAARVAMEREKDYGKTFVAIRESSRMYVRKNQSQWGWDWGPAMITSGPYKDINLELSTCKILDVHVKTNLSQDLQSADLTVQVEVDNPLSNTSLMITINNESCTTIFSKTIECNTGTTIYSHTFPLQGPELWYPIRHGAQPLYTATTDLAHHFHTKTLSSHTTRFGIRHVELCQHPLKYDDGTTFYFRINGRPIFCVGTNWVPPKSIYPNITPDLYQRWIDLAIENNNNMIRVWGGGVYEGDAFYDYCDEKGILIWHDMMFACGIYPTTDSFHDSVSREITAQAKRLRRHPCMALYCGDNEFYFMADRQGKPYDPEETGDWTSYPERKLYFDTIPNALKKVNPEVPYWPSSPFGGTPANNSKIGDVHQWDVWHGKELHWQLYPTLGGRFVSEFGLHGFPDLRTVRVFAPDSKTRYPNSRVMDVHNKSTGSEYKLGKYLWANFRINTWRSGDTGMSDFIYLSQLSQSEALTYACRSWRRGWRGPGREECAGILIWQLNDIYPVTSWSLVDSFFRKKPAFYTTKKEFAQIVVGIDRKPLWLFVPEDKRLEHRTNIPTFEIYASNFELQVKHVELRLQMYDWEKHTVIQLSESVARRTCTLKPNQSTELCTVTCPEHAGITEDSLIVFAATLHDCDSGEEINRHVSWPEPYRYLLSSNKTQVHATIAPRLTNSVDTDADLDCVTIKNGSTPAKGVLAYVDADKGEEAEWYSDNMLDLMPGEEVELRVKGLSGRDISVRWLYSWEQESAS